MEWLHGRPITFRIGSTPNPLLLTKHNVCAKVVSVVEVWTLIILCGVKVSTTWTSCGIIQSMDTYRRKGVHGSPPGLGPGQLVSSNLTSPTKFCGNCKQNKSISEFHRRGEILQAWCKSCRKTFDAAYWKRNQEKRIQQCKIVRDNFRKWYRSLKESKPCMDCENIFPAECMHWDHKDRSKKSGNLGTLVSKGSKSLILKEIKKCDLVCANCHAIRTYTRKDWFKISGHSV